MAELESELGGARDQLSEAGKALSDAEARLAETEQALEKALEMAKRRQDVAKRIKEGFEQHGISAEVDSGSGDVILDFGDDYFETDSAKLKPGMRKTIREAIPVYARSLFGDDKMASKISAVEIIGFASPTFGGQPVDPTGLSSENRKAVNYNLDLSYERARSIFEYVFDTRNLKFDHQDSMLPLIKVTGRSFFTEQVNVEDTGNLTREEFCQQYNCSKSQRVIIKFGLSEKGEPS